jgi:hypothetical protein
LNLPEKYRNTGAVILLFLYGIINIPVQLLHSHAFTTCKANKSNPSVHADLSYSDNCRICLHKFSAYDDPAWAPEDEDRIFFSDFESGELLLKAQTPFLSRSNKSPPAIS